MSTVGFILMLVAMLDGGRSVRSSRGRRLLFGGGPVARWQVEGWSVQWLGRLSRASEGAPRGGDVGGEVLREVGVGLEGGQGGLQVLVCIFIWVF
jgi:hypothetical protein